MNPQSFLCKKEIFELQYFNDEGATYIHYNVITKILYLILSQSVSDPRTLPLSGRRDPRNKSNRILSGGFV